VKVIAVIVVDADVYVAVAVGVGVAVAVTLIAALSTTKLQHMPRPKRGGHERVASYKMHGLLKINAMRNIFKCYICIPCSRNSVDMLSKC